MANRNYFKNENPYVNKVDVDPNQSAMQRYEEEEKQKRKKIEEEISDYKHLLAMQSNIIDKKEQEKLIGKLQKYKDQQLKKENDKRLKDALNIERKLALQRKKDREEERKDREEELEAWKAELEETISKGTASVKDITKFYGATIKNQLVGKEGLEKLNKFVNNIAEKASAQYRQVADVYSKYQTAISTRLQGSEKDYKSLQKSLLNTVGITPYIKTQTMIDNLNQLVETGIAFNLEQRAFIQTVSDKVATTFDAANASLLQIVKLQQADSTASRLGMEAYLTKVLNRMFKNTEYLSNGFDNVTNALVEATSQLGAEQAVEFEYIVQKWLGSLSSVGLSTNTVTNLAQAMGYLVTGNVSGLESNSMQNLIVMAASRAGLSYADMLTRGINIDETNSLLESVVEYLQEIGSSTNQVVKNQFASTFGVSVSDLRAASNLSSVLDTLSSSRLSYGQTIGELSTQLSSVGSRMSASDLINTVVQNAQFSLFSNIASSPALASLWEITDMIQSYTGGINIPTPMFMGTGVDLNTTVENLMKLGIMGVGSLGMIGDVVSGIGNTVNLSRLLDTFGIGSSATKTTLGSLSSLTPRGVSTSTSSYMGQSSGSNFYESALNKAKYDAASENEVSGEIKASANVDMRVDIADVLANIKDNIVKMAQKLVDGTISVTIDNPFPTNTTQTPGI